LDRIDFRSLMGGLLVIAVGAIFAVLSRDYDMGSAVAPGPGAFPFAVAIAAMVFGAPICVVALLSSAPRRPAIALRAPLAVLGAVAAFALLVKGTGLVPAVVACTLVSALASSGAPLWHRAALAAFLAFACWLIFVVLLGLAVPPFRNPL
jgi:Tripartite tricarboxylate transporter TctB family